MTKYEVWSKDAVEKLFEIVRNVNTTTEIKLEALNLILKEVQDQRKYPPNE